MRRRAGGARRKAMGVCCPAARGARMPSAPLTRAPCGAWRHVAAIRQRAVERYGEVPPHSGGCARRVSGLSA